MSRYVISPMDLICTVGQDAAYQFWCTDHRGEPFPMEPPAVLTVKDKLGQTLFETHGMPTSSSDSTPDPMNDAVLVTSPSNGMLQVTIPRGMSRDWSPGIHHYDVWATITDQDAQLTSAGGTLIPIFPMGQQLPIAQGRFIIISRTSELEDVE
jgi:hypothetical protein